MADNDSDSDEEVDILSSVDERKRPVMFGEHFTHHFQPSSISVGHIGSLHGTTAVSFFGHEQTTRQDSESNSEGSDSSQSESDSDDEGNEQNVAPRRPPPPLSHYQMSSPGDLHHTVNNNPTTPTQKKKFDERFWEEDPETYGVRRSGRSRKEPERFTVAQEGSGSEDEEKNEGVLRTKKLKPKGRKGRRISSASEDWSVVDGQGSDSESSDNYTPDLEVRNRPRPVPRPNARVPPIVPKPKDLAPRKKVSVHVPSPQKPPSRVKKLESEESDEGDENDDDDDDDESNRNSVRRAAVTISSYKEESEDGTDSDDLVEANYDTTGEYVEDDRECIERVLISRVGRPGEIGAITTVYAPEYEEMQKRGEPFHGEPNEIQYLIKWKGWSHLHNTWETEKSLTDQNVKGMKKLSNFIKKDEEIATWKKFAAPEDVEYFDIQLQMNYDLLDEYKEVERIIAHTVVKSDVNGGTVNQVDYLCKWQGLPYVESTWEDGALVSRFYQLKVDSYLNRQRSEKIPGKSAKVNRQRPKFTPIKRQPSFLGNEDLQLRDYQLDGLNWLVNSWCRSHSVILADEMGLGKTIQVISFLSYLYNAQSLYGPFLLVVPLSTMAAWQREFSLWARDMNVVVYLGDVTSRNKIREYEWYRANSKSLKFNALLTTYEILLKDRQTLGTINWCCLVVDEAHRLKNDDALLYKALMEFTTNHRILITGTPLQNSLKELWALLQFIMPNRFYSWDDFEQMHATQEEKEIGFSTLHKELEPFLLRRVKKDVEKSLPAKVEQILRVEMSSIQKQYYRWILTKNFAALNKGLKGNANSFLNIVMELKKCCNHAQLIRPDTSQTTTDSLQNLIRGSGKLFLLDKLLCRLKETGHRVLIFSQMVRMLDILAEYLQQRRFLFQRLDGSIRGDLRKQALDHFNAEGSEDFCFLLSTRAGGLGINLATADTVIIFDSDWNPQNDLQAQARAHRIGQRNQVNIYRLVSKGSIEEDILERAKRKMVLDHLIIQRMDTTGRKVLSKNTGAPSSSNPFNKEELAAILKFGAEELFKEGDGEDTQLQEMDIDDILRAAETRDSDDHPHTIGEELLSQFKVASIAMDEDEVAGVAQEPNSTDEGKSWSDIIPESDRKKIEEEEEQKKQLELYLPPRNRKTVKKMNYGKAGHSDNEQETSYRRKTSRKKKSESESDDDSGGEGKGIKRKRGRPRTIKREDVEGFSDAEIRRFVKSYKKFGRPRSRLDAIAVDAELEDKPTEDLVRLADILHNGCLRAVAEYEEKLKEDPNFDGKKRGATVRLSNVTINAPSVLKHEEELESLAVIMPADSDARRKFRLTAPAKSVHWGVPWDVPDDSMLLVGIYEYGLGSWEAIKADQSLSLSSKILPPGTLKPQDKHLQTRVEYLIKLLKQAAIEDKAEQLRKSSQMLKSKIRQLKQKDTKKGKQQSDDSLTNSAAPSPMAVLSPPEGAEDKEDGVAPEISQEGQNAKEGKKKRKAPKKKEGIKDEGDKPKRQKKDKKEVIKEKKPEIKDSVFQEEPPTPEKDTEDKESKDDGKPKSSYALDDMEKATFEACKEKMRPVKRALKMLESPEGTMTEKDQVSQTRQCLLKIGDHITEITSHYKEGDVVTEWRNNLWTFVSKFTSFEAKKLFKLYKHAAKKRDESKAQERTQNRPAPQSQRTPQDSSGMSRKHLGDHAPQRSSNDLKRQMEGGSSSHLGPGGKVPRMDRTNSGSSSHSGGRHSGGGDGYDPRRSSFSHSDRVSGSTKDRPRDGHDHSHRYHEPQRDRPSYHTSDYSRTHDRPSEHSRSHDQHSRASYERNSDHHSRSYEKSRDRRDDHHRSSVREYSSESRYHAHRDRNSDSSSSRHGNQTSSPKSGEGKRHGEDRRSLETDREKR